MTNIELKTIRLTWDLTQSQLAEKMGVSRRTVRGWEDGRTIPTWVDKMIALLTSRGTP